MARHTRTRSSPTTVRPWLARSSPPGRRGVSASRHEQQAQGLHPRRPPGQPGGLPRDRASGGTRTPWPRWGSATRQRRRTRCSAPRWRSCATTAPGASSAARSRAPGARSAGADARGATPSSSASRCSPAQRRADRAALRRAGRLRAARRRHGHRSGRLDDGRRPDPGPGLRARALGGERAQARAGARPDHLSRGPRRRLDGVRSHRRVRHRIALRDRPGRPADGSPAAAPRPSGCRCCAPWRTAGSTSSRPGSTTYAVTSPTCCPPRPGGRSSPERTSVRLPGVLVGGA